MLDTARQALQDVLTECARIEEKPETVPVIQRISAQVQYAADRLAALEKRMDSVAQSESPRVNGVYGGLAWRR